MSKGVLREMQSKREVLERIAEGSAAVSRKATAEEVEEHSE